METISVSTPTFIASSSVSSTSPHKDPRMHFYIDIEDVKWFYKEELDPKNKKKNGTNVFKWSAFNETDSFNLELEYRNLQTKKKHETHLVQVLDGLYEADLSKKESYPIYWESKPMPLMRSIWFNENGEPFEEKSSELIEEKYIELFRDKIIQEAVHGSKHEDHIQQSDLFNDKQNREPLATLNIEEGTIIWYSKDEVYWERNNLSVFDKMQLTLLKLRKKIHFNRISRGIELFTHERDNQSKNITHLVFVVHGIAQKLDRNKIYKCCEHLGKGCARKKKEYFSDCDDQKFMFLPVDWRSSLVLDDGLIESITIKNIETIRSKLNYSALDIMYYSSPIYKTEIMNSLSSELNRLYRLFCDKNKYFNGLVSVVAHSLGSVVIYDVLTSNTKFFNNYGEDIKQEKMMFNQMSKNNTHLLNEYLECKKRIQEIEVELINKNENNITPLDFKIENIFNFGSPLAVFLALRGVRPAEFGTQEHILPKNLCKHLFNIFHPSDPVAYRLEPLISKHYAKKCALGIQKSYDTAALKRGNTFYKDLHKKRHRKHDEKGDDNLIPIVLSNQIAQIELEHAIDFQLQESNFEFMAVLTSHNCYWKSSDLQLFITNQLIASNDEHNVNK